MTQHNLAEHLRWFLGAKPCLPPSIVDLPPASISFTTPTEETTSDTSPRLPPNESRRSPRRPSFADGGSDRESRQPARQQQGIPDSAQPAVNARDNMVRQRTAPTSASRPLVSMGPRLPDATPTKPGRATSAQSFPAPSPSRGRLVQRTPVVKHESFEDVEEMDLTEEFAALCSPKQKLPPPPVASCRKRKSDEFELDMRSQSGSSKRPALQHRELPRQSQEYESIDDIVLDSPLKNLAPSDPPPPYSTVPPKTRTPVKATQSVPRVVAHTAAARSNACVLDSEGEEDEDDLVSFSGSKVKEVSPAATKRKIKSPLKSHGSLHDGYNSNDLDIPDVPSVQYPDLRPQAPVEQEATFEVPLVPFCPEPKTDDPKVTPATKTAISPAPPLTAPSQVASPALEESKALLLKLSGFPSQAYDHRYQRLESEIDRISEVITDRIEDENYDNADLEEDLERAGNRSTALRDLQKALSGYQTLLNEKQRVKEVLRVAIKTKQPREAAMAASKSAKEQLDRLETKCQELLSVCEEDAREIVRKQEEHQRTTKIAVKSTQAPPAALRDAGPVIPSSSRVAQTQIHSLVRPAQTDTVFDTFEQAPAHYNPNNHLRDHSGFKATTLYDDNFDDDDLDDHAMFNADTSHFSNRMGTPRNRFDEEDDFGIDDDDEMLEVVQDFDIQGPSRPVFAETSGNSQMRLPPGKGKKTPAKRVSVEETLTLPEQFNHPWSKEVGTTLKQQFKLRGFRRNQCEAINATLAGRDVFVLMPTGGGKSLCYQLPAMVRSGMTRGVTIVISPLLSLMEDQVQHLRDLGIQAFFINSETPRNERDFLINGLGNQEVEKFIQLLYVTPEMLGKSEKILRAFDGLHRNKKFARLVIDEAHCVSQWGHDFRPDYKNLGQVRRRFPGVPVMALTATATENVRQDTIHNLGLVKCEVFTSSFNRSNLYYEVRPKGKGKEDIKSIAELILRDHAKHTGIIYCLSRKNCEDIAASLRKDHKIAAEHYHAGLEGPDKAKVQRQWQAGSTRVIVATIAFGMGIDKSNVRFVIHHSIPKSLEGYYQETGRAGRDGGSSSCYLYYGYGDASKLRKMIDDPKNEGSREQKHKQHEMLQKMVQYCENKSDCRRTQVLAYFGEQFNPADCGEGCDNCTSGSTFIDVDFTNHARQAINLVRNLRSDKVTVLHCIDMYRGANTKKGRDTGHDQDDQFGSGADLDRGDVERLFYRLLNDKALIEENNTNKAGFTTSYVNLGPQCNDFRSGRSTLMMQVHTTPRPDRIAKKVDKAKSMAKTKVKAKEFPMSTNVSSPVQAISRRKISVAQPQTKRSQHANGYERDGFVVDCPSDGSHRGAADEESDRNDGFEPVRVAGQQHKSRNAPRRLGPPITSDRVMDSLDEFHRDIVANFEQEASKKCKAIQTEKNLKMVPFSNTILRQMVIRWTGTEEEMLRIPGIEKERVGYYGKAFCKLVRKYHASYKEMMDRGDDDEVLPDPDAQNVIDLVTSGEEDEDEDEDYGSFVDDEDEEGQQSAYFNGGGQSGYQDAAVAEFNSMFSQYANQPRAESQPARKAGGKKKSYTAKPAKGRGGAFEGRRRNASGGSDSGGGSRSASGVSKRKATRGAAGSSRPRQGGGGGGGGAVKMMPT